MEQYTKVIMGVPGFFAWLMKRYKKSRFIISSLPSRPSGFYVDANCLFHPQCFKLLEAISDEMDTEELEMLMIKRIIKFLIYIENFVNPTKFMYISVDGVAPLAKINQQRKRRYKSVDDNQMKLTIKSKYGIKTINHWNNTVISPGTKFMERLHRELLSFYQGRKKKGFKYIYSSYHTAGEGEHKILQHMKTNKMDGNMVIYGLDADLIFLALASGVDNIYLLREETHFGLKKDIEKVELYDPVDDVGEELVYVAIDTVKDAYNEELYDLITHMTGYKADTDINFLPDFIFSCFLLGNDFLPHFPSIDIKKEGLDYVLEAYIKVFYALKQTIITFNKGKMHINEGFVAYMLYELGTKEQEYFSVVLPEYERMSYRKKCYQKDPYEKELWDIENMKHVDVKDTIRLGSGSSDGWKYRYYSHYYNVEEHYDEFVETMIKQYLEGIMWVTKYYFEKCTDWQYQYVYNHAPFVSDVASYLDKHMDALNSINFPTRSNIPIMSQLLSVLPPACSDMLASSYQKLVLSDDSPVIDMFPTSVKLDMLNKDLYWQCIPLVPPLDVDRIVEATAELELTKSEQKRNIEVDDYILG
jgi:5'-3' exonuclease